MRFIRSGVITTTLFLSAIALCAASAPAAPAGAPQIASAGIDASDRFIATWQLAPGTKFASIEFSSISIPDPFLPTFFAGGNFADFECAAPPRSCGGTPTSTTYLSNRPTARDRRYFVRVTAEDADDTPRASATWVIDDTKPVIAGEGRAPGKTTNMPALGHPFTPPAPETIPPPELSLLEPKTIRAYTLRGLGVRLRCPAVECFVQLRARLGSTTLTARNYTLGPDERRRFDLRPEGPRLRGRSRVRVRFLASIFQPGGKKTRIARTVTVRR